MRSLPLLFLSIVLQAVAVPVSKPPALNGQSVTRGANSSTEIGWIDPRINGGRLLDVSRQGEIKYGHFDH